MPQSQASLAAEWKDEGFAKNSSKELLFWGISCSYITVHAAGLTQKRNMASASPCALSCNLQQHAAKEICFDGSPESR